MAYNPAVVAELNRRRENNIGKRPNRNLRDYDSFANSGVGKSILARPEGTAVDPGGLPMGDAKTPTVLTDTNIRERVIPRLQQDASTTIANYDQNKANIEQQQTMADDKKFEQDTKKKQADPLGGAFDDSKEVPEDPIVSQQLAIIDRMMKSQDSTTRMMANRQKEIYDRQRAEQNSVSAAEQGSAGTALSRLGGRYTPGAGGQIAAQLQRGNLEKLAQIDDDELYAVEQLRAAQENKDFQLVGEKLKLLKDVRDERIKAQDEIKKAEAEEKKVNTTFKNATLKSLAESSAPADVIAAVAAAENPADMVTAAGEYLQTGEYAEYKRAAQAAGITPADPSTYYARKIYGDSAFGGGTDPFSGDVPFQATIEGAASYAGSVTGEKNAQKQLADLAKNGDYPTLLTRMEGLARKGMGAAMGTDVSQAQNQIKAIDNMSSVLAKYEAAGGDMNFLKGTEQQIATRIGALATDPRFASISTQLNAAFQQYRQQMSGAAFGASESAQYKSVFPSADKSFELNRAVMDGLRNFQEQNVDNAYETQLGEGYSNLKDYVEKGLTPTGKYLLKTETDAKNKVIELGQQDPAVQSAVSGFIQDNPEASAYDVLQFLGVPVATGNEVAMTDPSKGIVGGYDIKSYATDPNHEKRVATIYDRTKNLNTPQAVESYIRNIAPNSPIKGDEVIAAAEITGVAPGMILAIMQQDSTFATAGKAVRTKNPGNVGNDDTGALQYYPDWQSGILAVAENLAKRKTA